MFSNEKLFFSDVTVHPNCGVMLLQNLGKFRMKLTTVGRVVTDRR